MKGFIKGYDYILVITPILLACFGIMMIYSASMVSTTIDGIDSTYYLFKQLSWFILSLFGFIFCCVFPFQKYLKIVTYVVILSIILLISVRFLGESANNATRTLSIMGVNIQPSEFIKLTVILYLSAVYSKKQKYIHQFKKGVLPPLVILAIMVFLIVLQPDIGTASIIIGIASSIILASGIRLKHLTLLLTSIVTFVIIAIPYLTTDTRIARFTGAYQPFLDPDKSGYHLIQSYLAIGGGGIGGEGLGQSIQKLGYLWGAHTDFIMAVIAEELGVFGVIVVIGMFILITTRGFYIAIKCPNSFGALLAIGISAMVAIQAIVNMGAISGLLPITGVTLPFISYGGSSLLALMVSMGILNNIAKYTKKHQQIQEQ